MRKVMTQMQTNQNRRFDDPKNDSVEHQCNEVVLRNKAALNGGLEDGKMQLLHELQMTI